MGFKHDHLDIEGGNDSCVLCLKAENERLRKGLERACDVIGLYKGVVKGSGIKDPIELQIETCDEIIKALSGGKG